MYGKGVRDSDLWANWQEVTRTSSSSCTLVADVYYFIPLLFALDVDQSCKNYWKAKLFCLLWQIFSRSLLNWICPCDKSVAQLSHLIFSIYMITYCSNFLSLNTCELISERLLKKKVLFNSCCFHYWASCWSVLLILATNTWILIRYVWPSCTSFCLFYLVIRDTPTTIVDCHRSVVVSSFCSAVFIHSYSVLMLEEIVLYLLCSRFPVISLGKDWRMEELTTVALLIHMNIIWISVMRCNELYLCDGLVWHRH